MATVCDFYPLGSFFSALITWLEMVDSLLTVEAVGVKGRTVNGNSNDKQTLLTTSEPALTKKVNCEQQYDQQRGSSDNIDRESGDKVASEARLCQ